MYVPTHENDAGFPWSVAAAIRTYAQQVVRDAYFVVIMLPVSEEFRQSVASENACGASFATSTRKPLLHESLLTTPRALRLHNRAVF